MARRCPRVSRSITSATSTDDAPRPAANEVAFEALLVVSIVVGLLMVCGVGSLAAMVLPGFLKPPHQDQREVKANLKYAFTAERAYFQEKDEYRADFGEVGVHGTCPADCSVTMVAVGNVDADPDFDIWSISTQSRSIGGVARVSDPWIRSDVVVTRSRASRCHEGSRSDVPTSLSLQRWTSILPGPGQLVFTSAEPRGSRCAQR